VFRGPAQRLPSDKTGSESAHHHYLTRLKPI
jgi:hypothetical protein